MFKTQTADEYVTQVERTEWYNQNGGPVLVQGNDPTVLKLGSTVIKEGPLPNWKSLIGSGGCATTSLSGVKDQVSQKPYRVIVRRTSTLNPAQYDETRSSGVHKLSAPVNFETATALEHARNRSLINFYNRVQAVETAFKGLVFGGELRESLSLIRHPASALRRGIGDWLTRTKKYGQLPRRYRQSRIRASWLEASFGWSPLVNDIDTAIRAFYGGDLVHPIFEMVRGRGLGHEELGQAFATKTLGMSSLLYRTHDYIDTSVKHYGVYRHSGNGIPDSHKYGLRLNEFVPTLWELIPYSFLVDYFTNIGGILESWSYRTGALSFVSEGTRIDVVRQLDNFQLTPNADGAFNHHEVLERQLGSSLWRRQTVQRTPNVGQLVPSLELRVPGKWMQWANIAALTASLKSARVVLND